MEFLKVYSHFDSSLCGSTILTPLPGLTLGSGDHASDKFLKGVEQSDPISNE